MERRWNCFEIIGMGKQTSHSDSASIRKTFVASSYCIIWLLVLFYQENPIIFLQLICWKYHFFNVRVSEELKITHFTTLYGTSMSVPKGKFIFQHLWWNVLNLIKENMWICAVKNRLFLFLHSRYLPEEL